MSKKPKAKVRPGFFGGYIGEDLHSALKAEAQANDRPLCREIVHRLKLSLKTRTPRKALQAAE